MSTRNYIPFDEANGLNFQSISKLGICCARALREPFVFLGTKDKFILGLPVLTWSINLQK